MFSNSILKINTNLNINLKKLVNKYGGNYNPCKIPTVRKSIILNNSKNQRFRFCFLFYSTGNILLSNFHLNSDLNLLFSWLISFLLILVKNEIAQTKSTKLIVQLLIENLAFSIDLDFSSSQKLYKNINNNLRIHLSPNIILEIIDLFKSLENLIDITYKNKTLDNSDFPAMIFTIFFKRNNNELIKYKSESSKKRKNVYKHQNLLLDKHIVQKVSLTLFPNGKCIVTGCQTKDDIQNILKLVNLLIDYFKD